MEPTSSAQIVVAVAAVVFGSGGAAWAGTKAVLNGTREQVRDIKRGVDRLLEAQARDQERLTRLEERMRHLEAPE